MIDWYKVQQNEADRRIHLEVALQTLVDAVQSGSDWNLDVSLQIAQEALAKPFDKYEGAE